jgi:hypothetical protein
MYNYGSSKISDEQSDGVPNPVPFTDAHVLSCSIIILPCSHVEQKCGSFMVILLIVVLAQFYWYPQGQSSSDTCLLTFILQESHFPGNLGSLISRKFKT